MSVHEDCKFTRSAIRLKSFSYRKVIECDSGTLLTDMALRGHGILVRAVWDVREQLKSGELVQVLKNDPLETFGHIHAVIQSRRFLAPRVRAFFDFVVKQAEEWK